MVKLMIKYMAAAIPNRTKTSDTFIALVPLYLLAADKICFVLAISSITATFAKNELSLIVVIT